MVIKARKSKAVAMIQAGKNEKLIASETNLHVSIVKEIANSLTEEQLDNTQMKILATEEAVSLVKSAASIPISEKKLLKLENTVFDITNEIVSQITNNLDDNRNAKALETSLSTLSKIHSMYFKQSAKIQIANFNSEKEKENTNKFDGFGNF